MIRVVAYVSCLAALGWLVISHVRFRASLRTSLQGAYSLMGRAVPEHATDAGKVLNSYYEEIYQRLPDVLWPVGTLAVSATVLLTTRKAKKAEQARYSEPGDGAPVDNRGSVAPGR